MTAPSTPGFDAGTPAARGYRWPAEWERHAATWLCWPHNAETWPRAFERIPPIFAELAATLASFEPVKVVVGAGDAERDARHRLAGVDEVQLIPIATNDSWIRDFGPVFLTGPDRAPPAVVDWGYNAWGGKYPPFDLDAAAGQRIAEHQQRLRFPGPLILEPGAIDGNGRGLLLTTASCILEPRRNPGVTRPQAEQALRDCLGARKVLWLGGGGIAGDDTDGHIDQSARFVSPTTVVAAMNVEEHDEHSAALARDVQQLREMSDTVNEPLTVRILFNPPAVFFQGQRLPASYCNFYIVNGGVIVPTFDCPSHDEAALSVLQDLFPERTVVGFPCRDLVWGLGAVHCLTQQEPLAHGLTDFSEI